MSIDLLIVGIFLIIAFPGAVLWAVLGAVVLVGFVAFAVVVAVGWIIGACVFVAGFVAGAVSELRKLWGRA